MGLYLLRGGVEELAAGVHPIDPTGGETLMQTRLDPDGVLGEHQGVRVEAERDRRVAQLAHPFGRIQTAGKTDLHDAVAERANVRDDVDVAGADVRGAVV